MEDTIESSTDQRGYVYIASNCCGVEFVLLELFPNELCSKDILSQGL